MSRNRMPRLMPEDVLGSHWGDVRQSSSSEEQQELSFNARAQLEADQTAMRQLFAEMVRLAGGSAALTKALGREDTYDKKICAAINNESDRKVQLDWLAPLLGDPGAAELLLTWLSKRCRFAPPVRMRELTTEQTRETVTEVVAEMDPIVKEGIRREVARRRGVRVEDVKL